MLDAKEMRWRCLEPTPFARCAHSGVTMMRRDVLAAQLQRASGGGSDNAVPMDTSSDSDGPVVVIYGGFSGEAVEGDIFYIDPGRLPPSDLSTNRLTSQKSCARDSRRLKTRLICSSPLLASSR